MNDKTPGCGFLPGHSSLFNEKSVLGYVSFRTTGPSVFAVAQLPSNSDPRVLWQWSEITIRPGYPIFGAEYGLLVDEALRWIAKNQPAALTENPELWDGVPTELERRLAQMLLREGYTIGTIPALNPPHTHRLQACKIVRMYEQFKPDVPLPWRPSQPRSGRKPRPTPKPATGVPFMSPPIDPPNADADRKAIEGRVARLEDAFKKVRLALEEFG